MWVSDGHLLPKATAIVFDKRTQEDSFQVQAATIASKFIDITLRTLKDKYIIPDEFELLRSSPEDRTCSPPVDCYSV